MPYRGFQLFYMLHGTFAWGIGKTHSSLFFQRHPLDLDQYLPFIRLYIQVYPGIAISILGLYQSCSFDQAAFFNPFLNHLVWHLGIHIY